MDLLFAHIEQIHQSSIAISELPFTTSRPFTNALLRTTDITSLIRDTEAHERALFTLATANASLTKSESASTRQNRKSIYDVAGLNPAERGYGSSSLRAGKNGLRANSAVGKILGGDLLERIQRSENAGTRAGKGDVDVGALLDGAERLCQVYPIAGARQRISSLRQRHEALAASIERYEHIVEGQARELEIAIRGDATDGNRAKPIDVDVNDVGFTREDLRQEEREIRELEERRRLLEQRVHGMERDLGGLMK